MEVSQTYEENIFSSDYMFMKRQRRCVCLAGFDFPLNEATGPSHEKRQIKLVKVARGR